MKCKAQIKKSNDFRPKCSPRGKYVLLIMNYYYYCNSSKLINIAYSHITLYFYFIPLFYFIQQVLGKQSSPSTQTQKSRAFHSIGAKLSRGRWPTWVYALHIMRRKVSVFIKKLLALPYAPAEHITPAFLHLLQSANSNQLQQMMTYLSNTWLHNSV